MMHDLMEALQMLKFAIKKGTSALNFTVGMKPEDEIDRLLVLMAERDESLEDKNSRIQDILDMLGKQDLLENNIQISKEESHS
jgi:hypothetical protein